MRFHSFQLPLLLAGPLLATADTVGDFKVDFDEKLEGRTGLQKVAEEVLDKQDFIRGQVNKNDAGAVDERSLVKDSTEMLSAEELDKRQSCGNYGRCDNGSCAPFDAQCCATYGFCRKGRDCCEDGCIPEGTACCRDGGWCPAGNHCYIWPTEPDPVCCTNKYCTARVDESGHTVTATSSTTTRTYTTTYTQYYYWTVTWWYYSYYWTYSVNIDASIVTSTRVSESSTLSVRTTDKAAASRYLSSVSADLTLPTPASATSLQDLAGSTSYLGETSTSETSEMPRATSTSSSDDTGDSGGNDNTGNNVGGGGTNGGPGVNTARALLSHIDGFTMGFLTFGFGVGVAAIML